MKVILQSTIISLFATILVGCTNTIKKNELEGIWKSDDGAVLFLYANGTYHAKRLNLYPIFEDENFKNKKTNLTGRWQIGETGNQKKQTIELSSNLTFKDFDVDDTYIDENGSKQSYNIHCTFIISETGIFEFKKTYILYSQIGDPDDMNRYQFKKMN
ncbi:hypothetical protein [Flavobacterium sp. N2038]|uniref:hypothetical protein n=1 Tax=Flavobacterium sp. N2038 TaxID=2986829 RepID=UPI002225B499|nr:hypothetical protein [Flavobacterium sp. N2038]